MNDTERQIFDELIVAATKLCTATDNAAVVLSEKFEGMVTGPLTACQAVLAKCPRPQSAWDGSVREEDLEVVYFRAIGQSSLEESKGVRIRHTITGLQRESYSKNSREKNHAIALRALTTAVRERYEKQPA